MKVLIGEPGKYPREADIEHTLEAEQKIVGGTIEAVYPWRDSACIVCNDNGIAENLPLNRMVRMFTSSGKLTNPRMYGSKRRPYRFDRRKYNCFQRGQRNKGGRDCDGQALYLAERVDAIVLKIVEEVFEQIRDTPYSQVAENRIRQESNLQKTKRAAAEKKIKAAQHALERFEGEILKCLDGTSNFTEDMIAKQIRRYQQELDDAKAEYAELQNARLNEAAEIRKLRTYYDDFKGWAEEFDTAPLEMKRMILSHLIDRVEVGRKYQVIVKFNMKYRQFLECTAETYNTEIGA